MCRRMFCNGDAAWRECVRECQDEEIPGNAVGRLLFAVQDKGQNVMGRALNCNRLRKNVMEIV